ncbi:hypothetical protein BV898_02526 [Hypsibius exemplaris]|uniref:RRM domain-containing protein n=1 Tax=Hypsibius exemplaris TaxID=2072580 RepID=A0A1W0X960_HYPEX|nr:hypothetical protein BV898_02526 [Hypsibius exemplaris]
MSSSKGYGLFIGRIPKNIRVRELEDIFSRYGPLTRCDVKYSGTGSAFAFVDYEDRRDAEDAVRKENGRELNNYNIVVEWAKKPNKPGYNDRDRGSGGGRSYGERDYRGNDRVGRGGYDSRGGSDRRRNEDDRSDRRRRRTRSPDDSPDKSTKRSRRSESPTRNGKEGDQTVKEKERTEAEGASPITRKEDSCVRAASTSPSRVDNQAGLETDDLPGNKKKVDSPVNGNGTAIDHHSRSGSPNAETSPHPDVEEEAEHSAHEEEEEDEKNGAAAESSHSRSRSASGTPSTSP